MTRAVKPNDDAIAHFEQMKKLAARLAELPAEIRLHEYDPEAFGSWWVVLRFKGDRFRLSYDGRDSELTLERSDARRAPDVWGPHVWRSPTLEGEAFFSGVIGALRAAVASGA